MTGKTPVEWARDHDAPARSLASGLAALMIDVDDSARLVMTSRGVDVIDSEGNTIGSGPNTAAAIVDAVRSAYRSEVRERARMAKAVASFRTALRGLMEDE